MLPPMRTLARTLLAACIVAGAFGAAHAQPATNQFPGVAWNQVDPAQRGWSVSLLVQARAWSQTIHSSAVMIIQHGSVVAEWGDTSKRMDLASVRKSLLSALIGNAVARRQIDLAAPIAWLGIDDNAPSLTAEEKTATVRDLLQARSGIYHAALYETPAMAARRPPRGGHQPGMFWYYNNWDFNTLGAIYLHATGTSVFDALQREIAQPIQMQDYRPKDGVYFTGPDSVYPAYPIRMSARDLARFALLYLHDGRWRGRQVVPAAWVHDSTTPYSKSGFGPGYGYLWWTGFLDPALPTSSVHLPRGSFFAWGAGGQYAVVMPAADIVVVHRVDRDISGYHEVSLRELGRLLWLVLAAAHQPDIGPDTSMAAAHGTQLDDDTLRATLSGATLEAQGTADSTGFRWHLAPDGIFTVSEGTPTATIVSGTWTIKDGKFCDTVGNRRTPRCFEVFADGSHLQLFDADGLLQYNLARLPAGQ